MLGGRLPGFREAFQDGQWPPSEFGHLGWPNRRGLEDATGNMTFVPSKTTKTITIEVKGDSKKEADQTFYLDLFGNSSNALFTKNRGICTILNDD